MTDENRLATVTQRLLKDAREAITDLRITEDEIHEAARFLDRLGQAEESSDMLDIFFGVTAVVAAKGTDGGTTPNLAGPYYKGGAPTRADGRVYEGELDERETPLTVRGTVTDVTSGDPVPDAILDIWQADGAGIYDSAGYHLRGLVEVDEDGSYEFHTVLPEGYQIPAKGPTTELLEMMGQHNWRPAHIHLRVHVGDLTPLQTQFFIGGARFLDSDPVDAVRSDLVIDAFDDPSTGGKQMDFDIKIAADGGDGRSAAHGPKALGATP
jgi:protocatechuate 3,4-dioxygenase beta subunit